MGSSRVDGVRERLGASSHLFTDKQIRDALKEVSGWPGNHILLAADALLQALDEGDE